MDMENILCEVKTEFLCIIQMNIILQSITLYCILIKAYQRREHVIACILTLMSTSTLFALSRVMFWYDMLRIMLPTYSLSVLHHVISSTGRSSKTSDNVTFQCLLLFIKRLLIWICVFLPGKVKPCLCASRCRDVIHSVFTYPETKNFLLFLHSNYFSSKLLSWYTLKRYISPTFACRCNILWGT